MPDDLSLPAPLSEAGLSRRRFLAGGASLFGGVAAASLLAACSSSSKSAGSSSSASTGASSSSASKALKGIGFQFDWITNVQFAGSYVAQSKGYYAANGVNATLKTGGPNVAVIPVLQAGSAQIGVIDPTTAAQANAQGADLVIIGTVYQTSPLAVLSLAGKPITTPAEMVGKKIGIGATSVSAMKAFMKVNGLDYNSLKVVPIQFDPAPLVAGSVDGYVGFSTNEAITVEQEGHPVHSMLLADFGFNLYAEAYGVRKSYLADNRDLVKDFLTAEIKGWQDVVADPQAATDLTISKYGGALKLDPKQQFAEAQAQNQLVVSADTKAHGLMWMSDAAIQTNLKALSATGVKADASLFDNSLISEIFAGKSTI